MYYVQQSLKNSHAITIGQDTQGVHQELLPHPLAPACAFQGITGPHMPYTRGALMHFVVSTFFTCERDFPETANNRLRLPGFDPRSASLPSLF